MKYLLYWLIFSIVIINTSCSPEFPKEISIVLNKCDSQTVYLCIIESRKLNKVFPDKDFDRFFNKNNHILYENDPKIKAELDEEIASYFKSADHKDSVVHILNIWYEANRLLLELDSISINEDPPEAILYEYNPTAQIVKKHLSEPGQDLGSLSTYQVYEVNVDFMKYAENLTDQQRHQLYKDLRELAKKPSDNP